MSRVINLEIKISARSLSKGLTATFVFSVVGAAHPVWAQDVRMARANPNIGSTQTRLSGAEVFKFSISPQPLVTALDAFTAATGIQVIYNSNLAKGLSSPGVHGEFNETDALEALLAGTSLAHANIMENVETLVSSAAPSSVASTGAAAAFMAHAPALQLDPLRVEAPSKPLDHYLYGMVVELAIHNALIHADGLGRRSYRADLNVWLSAAGVVQHSELRSSTGDVAIDTAIAKALYGVTVQKSPPGDLPQPLHIRLSVGPDNRNPPS